jgi:hypothetical protein
MVITSDTSYGEREESSIFKNRNHRPNLSFNLGQAEVFAKYSSKLERL